MIATACCTLTQLEKQTSRPTFAPCLTDADPRLLRLCPNKTTIQNNFLQRILRLIKYLKKTSTLCDFGVNRGGEKKIEF